MALIAFDIDGVLETNDEKSEYVRGPVSPFQLHVLQLNHKVVMVSPSPYYFKNIKGESRYPIIADYGSNEMRHQNLLKAKEKYPQRDKLYLYVSDNGDYAEAKKAGFIYIDALMFANGY